MSIATVQNIVVLPPQQHQQHQPQQHQPQQQQQSRLRAAVAVHSEFNHNNRSQAEASATASATTSAEDEEWERCQELLSEYGGLPLPESQAQGARRMMGTLQALAAGCGHYVGYSWTTMPITTTTRTDDAVVNKTQQQEMELVHMYATQPLLDSGHVSFVIASALASKRDWTRYRIWLWLPLNVYDQFMQQQQQQKYPPFWVDCPFHVSVLKFDILEQAKGTVLHRRIKLQGLPGSVQTDPRFHTDAVRYIVLYKYGGLWVDVDSIFVNDISDLFHIQFPGYRYNGRKRLNGAMMHFYKGGSAITTMIEQAARQNRYGPYDNFKGMERQFWYDYNQQAQENHQPKRDQVQLMRLKQFETLCRPGVWCGFRSHCYFYENLTQNYADEMVTTGKPWYDLIGINDATHRIVHSHDGCKNKTQEFFIIQPQSPFQILLDLYRKGIQHNPFCKV